MRCRVVTLAKLRTPTGLAGRSGLVLAYLAAGESRRQCAYHDNYCDTQSWARDVVML